MINCQSLSPYILHFPAPNSEPLTSNVTSITFHVNAYEEFSVTVVAVNNAGLKNAVEERMRAPQLRELYSFA